MTTSKFAAQLTVQIGEEFAAHQQYLAIAAHYEGMTLPQLAGCFYRQAAEERGHAMMMVQYLLDTDQPVRIPATPAPTCDFEGVVAPIELAVEQEKTVTRQINALTRIARDENDFAAEQFMQWFIKEQVEEVSKMQDLLTVARRSEGDLNDIETYVERDMGAGAADPAAPRQAGQVQ
ncbi:ferritin [Janibacter limosus]|uniref:Ferritin n=1 Tax=Janibacter limosus TaxID=53458 RepID=A0A4P6MVB9_9MICO|nr:ferritin [Janibacter limosus]QBF47761.1 ferritin [Janibacter limosus]